MFDTILFDLDGTLTDSGPGIMESALYALHAFGLDEPDENKLRLFVGPPLSDSFERYGLSHEEALKAVEKYREHYFPIGIYKNTLYPGVKEMLQTLTDAGKHLYIATSKPLILANRVLDYFGITSYFDIVEGVDLHEHGTKEKVLSRLKNKIDFTDAIMVGDRKYDVEGARFVGLSCIGVTYGYGSFQELVEAGALKTAQNTEELTRILMQ